MVVVGSVEALGSPSPIIAAFARTAGASAPAGDVDDEELNKNKDVGEGEEKIEDENHDHDDQLVNKIKRNLQQVVSITLRLTVIDWMITDADHIDEQSLILREIAKFASEFAEITEYVEMSFLKQWYWHWLYAGQSYQSHKVVEDAR